jgi:hypothetical protein
MNTIAFILAGLLSGNTPGADLPPSAAMIGLDSEAVLVALRDAGTVVPGYTIERCSGRLSVEDGSGHRFVVRAVSGSR